MSIGKGNLSATVFSLMRGCQPFSAGRWLFSISVRRLLGLGGIVSLLWLGAVVAQAGVMVTPLHSFGSQLPNGVYPYAPLVQGSDGNFYGTANGGGSYGVGTVFQMTPAGVLTVLYSFTSGNDGASPRGALVQGANGNFYGTAEQGGANGDGTIFEITPAGVLTPLHQFAGQKDGANPFAALVQGTDGNFYGTTFAGGASGNGTVFQMTPSGAYTNLYSFKGKTDGSAPYAPLVQGVGGAFYGTTYGGGNTALNDGYGYGAIFSITTNGVVTPLYAFTDGSDGEDPYSALVQGIDGNFYGTAIHGTTGYGAIFQITPGGAFRVLYDFPSSINGSGPTGALVQGADTNFYGTTLGGGSNNDGTVFQITPNGVCTPLYSFTNGSDGAAPFAGLVRGANGILYGTTIGSQHYQPQTSGTIFQITTAGVFTPLFRFPGGSDGASPRAALITGTNGNLYGTTEYGGTNGQGLVFEITLDGSLTPLYSFTGESDGANPYAALVQGADGNFYGTDGDDDGILAQSGTAAYGTVFKMTPAGVVTVLHAFTNGIDGASPRTSLIQGADGNFYGTTGTGGLNGIGTIFRITPAGVLTNLHSFSHGSDGYYPLAPLIQGADTNFYGTTSAGAIGYGTVFKITPKGVFTVVHTFSGTGEGSPYAGLVQATDGNFYGTTAFATGCYGMVFRITPPNTFSILYSFTNGSDGANPTAALIQGADGNLYGTTSGESTSGYGTIFKITLAGIFTPLYSFTNGSDGAYPYAALVQGPDGNFYGATESGGQNGSGTVFQLIITPPSPPIFLSTTQTAGTLNFTWSTEAGANYRVQYCTCLSQANWICLGNSITATTCTLSACDVAPADAQRFYRVVLLP